MLLKKKRNTFKHPLPPMEINVVSLMDILTTLLFFLLLIATFSKLAIVPGHALSQQAAGTENSGDSFLLQVVFAKPEAAFLLLGPVQNLKAVKSSELRAYLKAQFRGNEEDGYIKKIESSSPKELIARIHLELKRLKESFPGETQAIAAFSPDFSYEMMVEALDQIRSLSPKEAKLQLKTLLGEKIETDILFPEVIISEWNGENS